MMMRLPRGLRAAMPAGFVLSLIVPLVGCDDGTKTTGTQVKISEEAKTQIQDMREMYKDTKGKTAKK